MWNSVKILNISLCWARQFYLFWEFWKFQQKAHKIQKNNEQEEETDPLLKQPEEYFGDDGRIERLKGMQIRKRKYFGNISYSRIWSSYIKLGISLFVFIFPLSS